jgi:predicted double-glycine peptidase
MHHSEQEIAQLSNRDADLGVSAEDIARAAKKLGLKVEIQNQAEFADIQKWLAKGVPVIVDWFSKGRSDYPEDEVADGHNSVVIGLDDDYIYLQDPEVGRVRKIERKWFYRVWFDFSSEHIEKWEDLIIRQLIAVYQ